MKKKIYTVIAAGILATGAAQAVTVDDLVQYGGDAIEIFYGNYKQRTLHDYVNGYVHFEKVNDSTVVLKNYYGLCDVPFILKDNKLVMAYTEDADNPTNTLEVESSKYAFIHITPQVALNQVYSSKNGLRYTSDTITEKNGEYQINFNQPVKIEAYNGSDRNYTLVRREWKNIYSVVVFKPNASITDYNVKAQKARSYKGKVTFNDDNTFTFINFGAKGYGIENYQRGNMIYSRLQKFTGGFDRDSAEVRMDYQQITSDISALSDNGYGIVYSYNLCRVDTAVTPYDFYEPLNGPVTFTGAHHTGASAWVTDSGDRRTLETVNMEFRPWSAFNVILNSNSGQPFVTDTRVTVPDHDVTLDVAFTSVDAATSADNANLNVDAAWKAAKNEWYVASYDLMMVPGKYTAAADVPLDKAVTLAAGVAKSATGCEAQVSVEAPVVESASTVDYTLFIKANYDAATGLTATLHNLYPVQFNVGVPTGVETTLAGLSQEAADGVTPYKLTGDDLECVAAIASDSYKYLVVKDGGHSTETTSNKQSYREYLIRSSYNGGKENTTRQTAYDQSNWILVDLSGIAGAQVDNYRNCKIASITGTYHKENPRFVATQIVLGDKTAPYAPNHYIATNFMTAYSTDGTGNGVKDAAGNTYYFMNPKDGEWAIVAWAVWDKATHAFYVPAKDDEGTNAHGFTGGFKVDLRYNEGYITDVKMLDEQSDKGQNVYTFPALIVKNTATSASAPRRAAITPDKRELSTTYTVYPLSLNAGSVVTGVSTVDQAKTVSSVVYYNLQGMASPTPHAGLNVVVTRYTDGSTQVAKVMRP